MPPTEHTNPTSSSEGHTSVKNKIQLIDIICEQLNHVYQQHHSGDEYRLVITGQNEVLVEVHRGIVINRTNLRTSQEEADVIIIHQLCELVADNPRCITVVCDDSDVFHLLVHHAVQQMTCTIIRAPAVEQQLWTLENLPRSMLR